MSLPRYPEYKDSGVAWLGELPSHWSCTRLKFLLEGMGSGGTPDTDNANYWAADDSGTPWVAIGDLSDRERINETAKSLTPAGIASKGLTVWPAGTLLFSMYASLGHTAELSISATTNQAILALLPANNVNQRFLTRWLEYLKPRLKEQASSNTQDNLNAEKVRNLLALALPIQEQTAIATFLDRETAKIDALIAEQEKLLTLLAEKRQATISHAVTKGLNPDAPMKDSGVEWLGEVPAHWNCSKLRRIAKAVQTGGTPTSELPSSDLEDGENWYTPGDFGDDLKLGDSAKKISEETIQSGDAKAFPPGSVLIVSIGATLGKVGYISNFASANQQINAVIPDENMNGYFLSYALSVQTEAMRYLSNASTIGIMNQEKTKEIWIAVPPFAEQQSISDFLDSETSSLDALTIEATRAIDLLKERRTALISAAVTGKIDVREAA